MKTFFYVKEKKIYMMIFNSTCWKHKYTLGEWNTIIIIPEKKDSKNNIINDIKKYSLLKT